MKWKRINESSKPRFAGKFNEDAPPVTDENFSHGIDIDDIEGEQFMHYNSDGTVTLNIRHNSTEDSVEITVPRDQEFELKTLKQMLDDRNKFIIDLWDTIAVLAEAHADDWESLDRNKKAMHCFNGISQFEWTPKVDKPAKNRVQRKK